MNCKTCRFLERMGGHGGRCRRYPPSVHYIRNANGDGDWTNEFPAVSNDDWCGEAAPTVHTPT